MPGKDIRVTDDLTRSLTHERPRPQGPPPIASGAKKPGSGSGGSTPKKRK